MDVYRVIEERQSCRHYLKDREIPQEVLDRILEAGRLAPSATNSQPWKFILVREPELRQLVASALTSALTGRMNAFAAQAAAFIVIVEEAMNVFGKLGAFMKSTHYPHIDIGIAASHMSLAATAEGLGSCMIGYFSEKKLKELLKIPRKKKVVLVISLGYTEETLRKKVRKPRQEVINIDRY